jgi:hypothetical protein
MDLNENNYDFNTDSGVNGEIKIDQNEGDI